MPQPEYENENRIFWMPLLRDSMGGIAPAIKRQRFAAAPELEALKRPRGFT